MTQDDAHMKASKKFNYGNEAEIYYGNLEKNKKRK